MNRSKLRGMKLISFNAFALAHSLKDQFACLVYTPFGRVLKATSCGSFAWAHSLRINEHLVYTPFGRVN